jgi:ethanolamine ammonia-lyase small subunit
MAELKQSGIWTELRRWTPARIGLGRVGDSLPTDALLEFELARALARDAVHASLDADALARELGAKGFGDATVVRSQARDRMEYLLRPDLGRMLDAASCDRLAGRTEEDGELAVVIADGLSALAPARHAMPLLTELRAFQDFKNVTVVIANQARVALGDAIGEALGAQAVLVLIGERPGLSSPDSLGAYLTWAPRVGRTDAERNCISNIRPEGLPYADAAQRIRYLLHEARRIQLSGIGLKDDSATSPHLPPPR